MSFAGGAAAGRQAGGPGAPAGARAKPSLRQAFVSLKHRHYRSLWYSQLASFMGMQMQQVARGLLAFQLTGSYTAVGVVMMAWGIPQLVFSLIGGALADRVNKKTILLISLLTAVLITTGVISIPILFVLGLFQGTLFAFNMPARQALVAELVPPKDLMNAIAVNNIAMNMTRVVGPALAGAMIATWDIASAFYAQAAMLLIVMFFLVRLPASTTHLEGRATRGNIAREIWIGLKYIGSSRTMLMLMLMAFVPTVLGMPYMSLLPGFAVAELGVGDAAFGVMSSVGGVGAIVGGLFVATMTDFPRKPLLQALFGLGYGASLVGLGLASVAFGYPGSLVALLAVGLFSMTYQTLNNTMVMAESKPEFYGRVMSVYMLTFSVFPLMSGPAGVLADAISAKTTFMLMGVSIAAFIAATMLLNPRYIFKRVEAVQRPMMGRPGAGPAHGAPVAAAPASTEAAAPAVAAPALGVSVASASSAATLRQRVAVAGRPRRDYQGRAPERPADYMGAEESSNGRAEQRGLAPVPFPVGGYGLGAPPRAASPRTYGFDAEPPRRVEAGDAVRPAAIDALEGDTDR
jgi:MFS family permease